MSEETLGAITVICITIVFILCVGDPDLIDAIIFNLMNR